MADPRPMETIMTWIADVMVYVGASVVMSCAVALLVSYTFFARESDDS